MKRSARRGAGTRPPRANLGTRSRGRHGSTSVEFALVGVALCTVSLGIVETGLLLWARTGLEVVAAASARCGAVGLVDSSSTCGSLDQTKTFAVTSATTGGTASNGTYIVGWGLPITIAKANVAINTAVAGSCGGTTITGNYYQVALTATVAFPLLSVFQNLTTMTLTACYPLPS